MIAYSGPMLYARLVSQVYQSNGEGGWAQRLGETIPVLSRH